MDLVKHHAINIVMELEAKAARDEATVRNLLGMWVSELEPAIAYRDGEIIGLTLADAPLGSTPPIFNPLVGN